jgi:hypothetical protein
MAIAAVDHTNTRRHMLIVCLVKEIVCKPTLQVIKTFKWTAMVIASKSEDISVRPNSSRLSTMNPRSLPRNGLMQGIQHHTLANTPLAYAGAKLTMGIVL